MAINKEQAKEKIKELVKEFSNYTKDELSAKSENQIKSEFIDPLFEALGWDMRKDAEREERILKGRADYILRLANQEVLVIEAKKTSVHLSEEEGRQAVSYAYHRKIKFAVLTNFKQIRIYHALSNIRNIDKNLLKDNLGYLWIDYENFDNQFNRLWFLSKESFEKEEINKLLSTKDEKLNKSVDESILYDLLQVRDWLSKDLKKLRMQLSDEQIDETVQVLINRLIFMRSVEDRGLEKKDFLLDIVKDFQEGRNTKRIWENLLTEFIRFDKEYNSKLFSEETLGKEIFFDDITIMKVITGLYYGTKYQQERYMFDLIPGDLFGSIYEQYLGTILAGTEKRVKLDSSSGKRKKMGIYYTPSYIVDYIVRNTVGEYVKDKSIDEILNVTIVDPACGSGSFLIRAFQEVCNIIEDKLKEGEISDKWTSFKNYKDRLNLGQKITILTNCIHGVDLDEKAVELAQLNLLLKLLEEETPDTKKRILPVMTDNIKCGNSLIDDTSVSDRAFNWKAQFKDVFSEGGFDVVVGNPPYGAELKGDEKKFLKKRFDKDKANNTASYFIFLGDLILRSNGNLSFIVPKQLTYTSAWAGTRKLLLGENLKYVIDSSEAFEDVELEQIIFIFKKQNKEDKRVIVGFSNKGKIIEYKSDIKYFNEQRFPIWITDENYGIFEKMLKNSTALKEIAKVNWGGLVARYLTKNKTADSMPCLRGREVQRYHVTSEYFIKKKDIDQTYYVKGEKLLFQRIVCRYGEKIIANYRNARIVGTYINDDNYADKTVTMIWDSKVNLKFLLALFNSKLINWFAHRYLWNRSQLTMEFMYEYARNFPLHLPSSTQEKKIILLVNQMLELQKKYHDEKTNGNEKDRLKQQIDNIDYEIDEEVYKLYGLTPEEIKIVEESLKIG
jgi:hypothetical protein